MSFGNTFVKSHPKNFRELLRRWVLAVRNSIAGLKVAFKYESAFKEELVLSLLTIAALIYLKLPVEDNLWIVLVTFLLLLFELVNTAIETIVDRVSMERHPLSKRAKDIGSAAVFVAGLLLAVTWCFILYKNNILPI